MDLKLDIDEDCPRRLVIFPSGQIVAFGGDDGTLTCFDAATQKVRTIKQYDDAAVRALAVSSDGTRVAVGFDNGSTRIYRYDDYINSDNNDANDNKNHHPFVPPPRGENNKDEDDDNDDNFGGNGFLSQPDIGMDDDDDEEAMEAGRLWAGPQMEGAIRDLMFLPNSHWLAVAAESGLCIVNAHSADTMTNRYLQHQVEQEHDACGIRGVAVTTGGNGTGNDNHQVLMASLGMDGRLCVWQVNSLEKLPSVDAKVPCFRDQNRCVPIKDIGELNGADSADRSCFPYWVKPGVLALPGKAHVQLRAVNVLNDSLIVEDVEPKVANDDPSKGHIESIVALTSVGDHVVSSGRDGRVILWKLQEDNDGLPTAQFVESLQQYESIPTSLYWDENSHVLYLACANGKLEMVPDMDTKLATKKTASDSMGEKNNHSKAYKAKVTTRRMDSTASANSKNHAVHLSTDQSPKATSSKEKNDSDKATNNNKKNAPSLEKVTTKEFSTRTNDLIDSEDEDVDRDEDNNEKTMESSRPLSKVAKNTDNRSMVDDSDDDLGLETQLQSVSGGLADMDSDDEMPSARSSSPKADADKESPRVSSQDKKDKNVSVASNGLVDSDDDEASFTEATSPPVAKKATEDDTSADKDGDKGGKDAKSESSSPRKSTKRNSKQISSKQNVDDKDDDANDGPDSGSDTKSAGSSPSKSNKRLSKQTESKQDDDDDDDDDDDIFDDDDASKSGKDKPGPKNAFIDDEAEDAKDDDDDDVSFDDAGNQDSPSTKEAPNNAAVSSTPVSPTNEDSKGIARNIDNHDDEDNGFHNYGDDDDDNSMADDIAKINSNYQQSRLGAFGGPKLPELQAAFAPSSTPLDLTRRFLCWNNVGSITLMQGENTGRSTIDVHFTDSAFRRPISFTDNMGFILGSLGDDGGIFATDLANDEDDLDDDDDVMEGLTLSEKTKAALKKSQKQRMRKGSASRRPTGSSIFFHRFEPLVGNMRDKDWYLTLPDGERVLGCACGLGWAAVVTSRKFLRLYSSGGAQGQILWVPGNPVTIVGRNRFLAIFYHESMPLLDGTQHLGYMLFDAVTSRTVSKGSVSCISAGSSLSWAGFSNDLSLMAMDSDGMLSMLVATSMIDAEPNSWDWAPVLDTIGLRKSADDNYWPITVYDGKLVCIPLKGGIEYPDAGRRPITATLGMKMPLARSMLAKSSALEELSVRANMALVQKKVNNELTSGDLMGDGFDEEYHTLCAQVDKVTLKLFASTVEAGKLERALDLVHRLHLEKSYDLAMVIAENHDKLVDHIEEAKEVRFAGAFEDWAGDEDLQEEDGQDYNDNENSLYESRTSPPRGSSRALRISPEADQSYKPKRSLEDMPTRQGRNVRSKAY